MNDNVTTQPAQGILYLSRSDIVTLGGGSPRLYVDAVKRALTLHAQQAIVQPLKPYLRWYGERGHIADRIIAMPAYLGGEQPMAGLKWVGSKHDNPAVRNCDRASALIILNDPETHYPVAVLEGGLISGMRTAAVSVIGVEYLARPGFATVACLGCGPIAQMQLLSVLEANPQIARVELYDLRVAAAEELAATLGRQFPQVAFGLAAAAEQAVRAGDVVITCTVADTPYIPFAWLKPGAFVSNISIMDLQKDVFLNADKVVVDDWEQCNREKKVLNQLVLEGRFSRERVHAELGEIVQGTRPGREAPDEIIVLNPMGMAIEDVACAQLIYQQALLSGAGTRLSLN